MKTYKIKMIPKKGGPISYAIMQSYSRAALWGVAEQAYPGFTILNIEQV